MEAGDNETMTIATMLAELPLDRIVGVLATGEEDEPKDNKVPASFCAFSFRAMMAFHAARDGKRIGTLETTPIATKLQAGFLIADKWSKVYAALDVAELVITKLPPGEDMRYSLEVLATYREVLRSALAASAPDPEKDENVAPYFRAYFSAILGRDVVSAMRDPAIGPAGVHKMMEEAEGWGGKAGEKGDA